MKAAELLVNALEAEGVEYVFGLPGEENLEFLEALRGHPDIQTVLVRQEQAAGFMAATYERLTGKIAVAYSTGGPTVAPLRATSEGNNRGGALLKAASLFLQEEIERFALLSSPCLPSPFQACGIGQGRATVWGNNVRG